MTQTDPWFAQDSAVRRTLVIAEDFMQATAHDAVLAAYGSAGDCVDWSAAADWLAGRAWDGFVLAEASGADDAAVERTLSLLDALARDGDARVVVSFDVEQIDVVATGITAPDVALLCAPTASERVVALCLAAPAASGRVQEGNREAEAERLRRLNEEVARIAETLARLTRGEGARASGGTVGAPAVGYRVAPAGAPDIPARDIRDVIRARRLRDQVFAGGLFEDPAWDMLLDLFAADLERAQVSVSSLCIAAAVAPTTALRWITRMTEAGLFEREADPFDRRRAFMRLSKRAAAGMRDYVATVRRAGLAIA